jgi:fumarate hydratase class I
MWTEKNTGTNLPRRSSSTPADGDAYKFLFMAKGGGSANKSYLYQETKALLNPKSMRAFLDEEAEARSAPPPARRTTSRS